MTLRRTASFDKLRTNPERSRMGSFAQGHGVLRQAQHGSPKHGERSRTKRVKSLDCARDCSRGIVSEVELRVEP